MEDEELRSVESWASLESEKLGKKKGGKGGVKGKGKRLKGFDQHNLIVPKGRHLLAKTVAKLEHEDFHYTIARAIDLAKKYKRVAEAEHLEEASGLEPEEIAWRFEQRNVEEEAANEEKRIERLRMRERKRRKKYEDLEKEELHRRKYRWCPNDPNYQYIEGYQKIRHRITKRRFMTCVDIPLFREVLERSGDLKNSPLWDETLNLNALSYVEARKYKEHMQQFEVITEALKQGIFDLPGCDDIPVEKVRRKRPRRNAKEKRKKKYKYSKYGPNYQSRIPEEWDDVTTTLPSTEMGPRERRGSGAPYEKRKFKRPVPFPPYEDEEVEERRASTWKEKVQNWLMGSAKTPLPLHRKPPPKPDDDDEVDPEHVPPPPLPTQLASVEAISDTRSEMTMSMRTTTEKNWKKGPATTASSDAKKVEVIKAPKPEDPKEKEDASSWEFKIEYGVHVDDAYADYMSIPIPANLTKKKRFIRGMVEKKTKAPEKQGPDPREEAQRRHEGWYEDNQEPLQMLHQDEKDSDIWTITTTTTTNSYASWRRLPDLANMGKQLGNLASAVDDTLAWRLILILFVLWEICGFVVRRLDDVYYNTFTSYLYRENIWHYNGPRLFAPIETSYFLVIQEYFHLFVSLISLSIIHRKNECVSLLFAFSLLIDGCFEVGACVHDSLILPEQMKWWGVILNGLHIAWKAFAVNLFVGYHYYTAGYIRKAREFKHRKTRLHNHEINVKGTKGLLKRRLAWNWMTQHARNTNLKRLKKKYPKVKDGNFPPEELDKEIKFSEVKELRYYAQQHNLNIGYPYNRLEDMKRFVFGDLEKSDYTTQDEIEERLLEEKKKKVQSKTPPTITADRWHQWRRDEMMRRVKLLQRRTATESEWSRARGMAPRLVAKNAGQLGKGTKLTFAQYCDYTNMVRKMERKKLKYRW